MIKETGKFIISLDFELYWGIRDEKTLEEYGPNIIGVWEALPKMLEMFDEFNIKVTFAIVGFLFTADKKGLYEYVPDKKPNYTNQKRSPYLGHFDLVNETEAQDKYHFATELIKLINNRKVHEIATHTFSHYYCLEEGAGEDSFRQDLTSAISIASKENIQIKSIVFPKNQVNSKFLKICKELGINSYRGNEKAWFYRTKHEYKSILNKGVFRFIDSYINISGHNSYKQNMIDKTIPLNIPSSRFLRPYSSKFGFLENIRKKRITKSMSYSAKNGLIYHLWWHPHNYGVDQEKNLIFLKDILLHFKKLNSNYSFESLTMNDIVNRINETR